MYDHSEAEAWNRLKLEAAIHGIDIEGVINNGNGDNRVVEKKEEGIFRDPDEYKDLTDEEKETLTREMMGRLKQWAKAGAHPFNVR